MSTCSGLGISPPWARVCAATPQDGSPVSTNQVASSPLLRLDGAVATTSVAEPGVAAHYGDPFREQRSLASGAALVDLSSRGVVAVTGPDRLTWLDSLTSQALADLAPGECVETLLLDPQGRIEHIIRLCDDGQRSWLLLDRDETVSLVAWLDRMRFLRRVEVADRTAEFATLGSIGSGAATDLALSLMSVPVSWRDPWMSVQTGGWQYASTQEHPAAGWDYRETLIPRQLVEELPGRAVASAVSFAGVGALEALRIAVWRPRHVTEVDERSLPHELDLLRSSVHLAKGCYRGQETVAKVHNLGHPPRRLVLLQLDGSDSVLPSRGAMVCAPKRGTSVAVGVVTASAWHWEDGPIALAMIKRSVPADLNLTVIEGELRIAAVQEIVVPPGAGAVADVPRLPRLGSTTG
ncbi:folate-binding protein [Rathayibacter toxicus]|uniref:Folate-binding protein n=1 Tax=Rathayibacter toxicus TaxID=145458 RepID=A0A2S5Y919_9MICO|nr:folate-binding protein [Rathayibacter toxicus]PPG47816.1 folate-binding protein [Rathayibacter toxicus]PPH24960.1 folate-binding protein [Rathayibacter toxicus]PPH58884.1 folate-binding protein [Rathayibacter toxicus]PPH60880.1 folate-binding protein [Rathayibacter toxicus]